MKNILIILFAIFISANHLSAQVSSPYVDFFWGDKFNNRPLGYLNDGSAVAYNPALLGTRTTNGELMFAVPYSYANSEFSNSGVFGAFFKLSAVSLGWVNNSNNGLPMEIYAGVGFPFPFLSDHVWVGFSALALKQDGVDIDFDNTRLNSSLIVSPMPELLLSAGYTNMHRGLKDDYLIYSQGIYSPLDWLSIHYDYRLAPSEIFIDSSSSMTNIGLSFGVYEDFAISTMYNLNTENLRLGLEYGPTGIGLFTDTKTISPIDNSGAFIVRFGNDDYLNHSDIAMMGSIASLSAECNPNSYYWQRTDEAKSPAEIATLVRGLGNYYTDLSQDIDQIAPNSDELFKNITKKYYPLSYVAEATQLGIADNFIKTKFNYNIFIESKDESMTPKTSLLFKVKDKSNRNIANLSKEQFSIADTNFRIVKVEQTSSTKQTPVDIVFIMDASGSMSEEINSINRNLENFANQLSNRGVDIKLGAILFGNTILETIEPTSNVMAFKQFLSKFKVDQNAYAECTSTAIAEATDMKFRDSSEKILIVITDECMLQTNSKHNEATLTQLLWSKGIKLYSMISYSNHNAGLMTKLTLGRDYDILTPFNEILDKIAGDVSTTYELVYEPIIRAKVIPKVTVVQGEVKDTEGWKIACEILFKDQSGKILKTKTNAISGKYELDIEEGKVYEVLINSPKHKPFSQKLDLTAIKKGDTLNETFVLQIPKTMLRGTVYDENNQPITAAVSIRDAVSNNEILNLSTKENGTYETEIQEGLVYSIAAKKAEYINIPLELDLRNTKKGDSVVQDLQVIEILAAIEKGLTFKMKNILFDSGKWDIKSESEPELLKLVAFMTEYNSIKVEIGAHTDNVGKDDANKVLSGNRAQSVMNYLISKGITETRLTFVGYGESVPVATNETPEGKALNRRVEFKLIK